jgi:hypothetical protein
VCCHGCENCYNCHDCIGCKNCYGLSSAIGVTGEFGGGVIGGERPNTDNIFTRIINEIKGILGLSSRNTNEEKENQNIGEAKRNEGPQSNEEKENQNIGEAKRDGGSRSNEEKKEAEEVNIYKDDDKECSVCMSNEKSIIFLPCRHFHVCRKCTEDIKQKQNSICPICMSKIEQFFDVSRIK